MSPVYVPPADGVPADVDVEPVAVDVVESRVVSVGDGVEGSEAAVVVVGDVSGGLFQFCGTWCSVEWTARLRKMPRKKTIDERDISK